MGDFAFFVPLIKQYGYFAVGVGLFLECMGLPFPGEAILILGAASASLGHLNIVAVIAVAALAAIVGDSTGYFIGKKFGRKLLKRFEHISIFSPKHLERAERFFKSHGNKTVFIGRFTAILRTYSALLAGVCHMPYPTFLFYNVAGGIMWASLIGFAGFEIGNNLPLLWSLLADFQYLLLALFLAFVSYKVFIFFRERK